MKPERSLTRRIARAFVLLAVILAGFFCLVSYIAVEVIESQVIDARLDKIADTLIGHHLRSQPFDTPPDISFFANDAIPAEMRAKEPGLHELLLDRREVAALIRVEGGNRYAVVQDMDDFEHAEFIIFSSLGAGFVSSLLLAVILGIATARRIVAPVRALADAIGGNARPSDLPSLDAGDEIGVLARAFAGRTEELQQFLMRERLFTGDVSHELRTPLTVMLGAAEVLKTQLANQPRSLDAAERLRRVAADTAERVSALLLLSRAPEQLGAPRIALNPLVRAELDRYQPLLRGKPVECRFEESADVWIDARPELVGIAVGNLLRNACQHTEQGSVLVRLDAGRLAIEDTGPGIPTKVSERLFERFVRGRDDTVEGTGLGLSIVKRVVEHLGWEVHLERPDGGGSRFILTFPAVAEAPVLTHS